MGPIAERRSGSIDRITRGERSAWQDQLTGEVSAGAQMTEGGSPTTEGRNESRDVIGGSIGSYPKCVWDSLAVTK